MLLKAHFLLFSFLLMQQALANVPVYKDTIIHPKAFRMNQQQFLDTYGTDDTSSALIQYYFTRNKQAKGQVLLFGITGALAGFIFDSVVMSNTSLDALSGLFVLLLLGSVIYLSGVFVFINVYRWIRFSRQRLRKQLERRSNGKPLRRSIYRNSLFRHYVGLEKNLSEKEKR
jgi:hypothetical protein